MKLTAVDVDRLTFPARLPAVLSLSIFLSDCLTREGRICNQILQTQEFS